MATLSALVKIRIGNQRLVELTREDNTLTTIDDTVLDAACDDTIGAFRRVSRVEFDSTVDFHVQIGVSGVLYFLMEYKGIDSREKDRAENNFYGALGSLSRLGYMSPQTSSNLNNPRESANSISDMNRKKRVFKNRTRANTINDFSGDC